MAQQEYFGVGSLINLRDILLKVKPNKIFLVTGKNSYKSSGAKEKLEPILTNYQLIHFLEFSTNPKLEDVKKGIKLYKKENCDFIIAVGGGSTIDIAKCINVLAAQQSSPEDYICKNKEINNKGYPLVAIPTTAGTGSEATHFAVVYIDKLKYSLADEKVLPNYVIIDSSLTFNLPKKITAVTGMDAFGQAIEAYWSVFSTEEAKEYAREAMKLILANIEVVVNNPTSKARIAMTKAANLSGKAINISKTTACHAISYPITSYFNVPHGHAVALTLGEMMIYNNNITYEDCLDHRGVEYVKKVMRDLCSVFGVNSIEEAKEKIKNLMRTNHLETNLRQLNIYTSKDINIIIQNCFNSERFKNNPRKLTEESLKEILMNLQ